MNDKDYKNALIKVRDAMKNGGDEFICVHLNLEATSKFTEGKNDVPEEFRGKYWNGDYSWWNFYGNPGDNSYEEVINLKIAYLDYLIKEIVVKPTTT